MIVGALGTRGRARVDDRGRVAIDGEGWALDWWIGADDRARVPEREASVRHLAPGGVPVAETRMRVPGGDAVQRVYGIGGPGGLVVVEVENDAPAAFVVGFALAGARSIAPTNVAGGAGLEVDGRMAIVLPYAPPRWSVGSEPVVPATAGAETGVMPARRDRRGVHIALCYPLSHRSRLRIGLVTSGADPGRVDLPSLPGPDQVARGWVAHLERGMRVALGDAAARAAVDLARTQILLDPDPDAATAAALEDWGYDAEAEWAWKGLSLRARRVAARRDGLDAGDSPAAGLLRTRAALVREQHGVVDLLPAVDRSGNVEVLCAPTRSGTVSFALRWHGDRAALLWEVTNPTPDLVLRASSLDPSWSTTHPSGEALLSRLAERPGRIVSPVDPR